MLSAITRRTCLVALRSFAWANNPMLKSAMSDPRSLEIAIVHARTMENRVPTISVL